MSINPSSLSLHNAISLWTIAGVGEYRRRMRDSILIRCRVAAHVSCPPSTATLQRHSITCYESKYTDCASVRYPDPAIKVNDTVKIELSTGKILDFVKFDTGAVAMATGGRNMGRVGVVTNRER